MWPFRKHRSNKPAPKKQDTLAAEVRVKGVTRPHHRAPDPMTAEILRRAQLDHALQTFLSAENWQATHDALVRDQDILLSDDALHALEDLVRQARSQPEIPGSGSMADYLEAHRVLISRARRVGIDQAWLEFRATRLLGQETETTPEPPDPQTQAISDALKRLLGTESWQETYAILAQEQAYLLTDTADQFLSALLQVARQDQTPRGVEGARYLELHRTLLREARALGIDAAWAHFDEARRQVEAEQERAFAPPAFAASSPAVAQALQALLTAESWTETRQVLEQAQSVLLTDDCDVLLSELLAAAQRDPDPLATRSAIYLRLHQRLLRQARRDGIQAAWRDFEEALEIAAGAGDDPRARFSPAAITPQLDIAAAVTAFLNAASWPEARAILEARQQELLTEAAITLIQDRADTLHAHGAGRDLYAARLLRLQAKLLRQAREIGIPRAWAEFETERD